MDKVRTGHFYSGNKSYWPENNFLNWFKPNQGRQCLQTQFQVSKSPADLQIADVRSLPANDEDAWVATNDNQFLLRVIRCPYRVGVITQKNGMADLLTTANSDDILIFVS